MNKQFGNDDPRVADYVSRVYTPEDDLLRDIRERTARAGLPDIQVAALDARHLEVLARAIGARRTVEIGTLGGYSGVSLLRGMGDDGVLDTIEIDPAHAAIAAESFRRAGFADRARIHIGPALAVLPTLRPAGPFDLCFIDADKESYPQYLAWAAENLRQGGAVLGDNAFLFGKLTAEPKGDGGDAVSVRAMRAFHDSLASGGLFRATVLPTGEGLALGIRL
ncbi:MAG TPA: O-methyltransferase [Polyangia bacterium]|jgi:caffeoyl-CoA O-methyltransferase|nr:O-methyltransferase [Polyangia bacterium]